MERISDQCSDLAVYMISSKIEGVSGNEHQYVHDIHHSNDAIYQKSYDEAYAKYVRRLNNKRVDKSKTRELFVKEA
jgi:phosphate:Na+ symporter